MDTLFSFPFVPNLNILVASGGTLKGHLLLIFKGQIKEMMEEGVKNVFHFRSTHMPLPQTLLFSSFLILFLQAP